LGAKIPKRWSKIAHLCDKIPKGLSKIAHLCDKIPKGLSKIAHLCDKIPKCAKMCKNVQKMCQRVPLNLLSIFTKVGFS
jgi:hypothetical protein